MVKKKREKVYVVQASYWLTEINRMAYDGLIKLLKKYKYDLIKSKEDANRTVLWFDAVALKVLRSSKQKKWPKLLREHRLNIMTEAYGFKRKEVEDYFDNIDELDREALTSSPTPNFFGSLWLTLGMPREDLMLVLNSDWRGFEFVAACSELAIAHAGAVKELAEKHDIQADPPPKG